MKLRDMPLNKWKKKHWDLAYRRNEVFKLRMAGKGSAEIAKILKERAEKAGKFKDRSLKNWKGIIGHDMRFLYDSVSKGATKQYFSAPPYRRSLSKRRGRAKAGGEKPADIKPAKPVRKGREGLLAARQQVVHKIEGMIADLAVVDKRLEVIKPSNPQHGELKRWQSNLREQLRILRLEECDLLEILRGM